MKTLAFILSVLSLSFMSAQTINDKGLYIENNKSNPDMANGDLFNGVVSKTENGIKTDLTVKEGVIDGPATYYYASGNVMEKGMFNKGKKDQKWIRYNENGSVAAIAFYALGKKSGTWLVFDEKGNKRFEMNYTDGEKSGVWTNWDENGAVASTKDYSKLN